MKTLIRPAEVGINSSWVIHRTVLLLVPILLFTVCGTLCLQGVPACFVVASALRPGKLPGSNTPIVPKAWPAIALACVQCASVIHDSQECPPKLLLSSGVKDAILHWGCSIICTRCLDADAFSVARGLWPAANLICNQLVRFNGRLMLRGKSYTK